MDRVKKITDKQKGIIFIILSAFNFSVMNTLVKFVEGVPSIEKAMFRNAVALLFTFIILVKTRLNKEKVEKKYERHFLPNKGNEKILLIRSIAGTLGLAFLYISIDRIDLTDATMLNKLSPFFMILFSYIFLKEKIYKPQIIALIIAFLGAMLVIRPTLSIEVIPYIIGMLSGLFAGLAYTCVRYLSSIGERSSIIIFYFSLTTIIILSPVLYFVYVPLNESQFMLLILSGLFASFGQFALTKAYSLAPSKEISIYDYSQMIFSSIWGYLVFAQVPNSLSLTGYFVILVASMYMYLYNNKKMPL